MAVLPGAPDAASSNSLAACGSAVPGAGVAAVGDSFEGVRECSLPAEHLAEPERPAVGLGEDGKAHAGLEGPLRGGGLDIWVDSCPHGLHGAVVPTVPYARGPQEQLSEPAALENSLCRSATVADRLQSNVDSTDASGSKGCLWLDASVAADSEGCLRPAQSAMPFTMEPLNKTLWELASQSRSTSGATSSSPFGPRRVAAWPLRHRLFRRPPSPPVSSASSASSSTSLLEASCASDLSTAYKAALREHVRHLHYDVGLELDEAMELGSARATQQFFGRSCS